MAGKCNRCGRLGAVMGRGICPDCLRAEAEEKRNRILENQALQEQKAREEQARLERVRDEQERKYREEQSRRERERDEQERKFREEQLRHEREDRQRQLEAENRIQEERLQIERDRMEAEQQRYEEEKREREWKEQQERLERERQEQERAWAERCEYLDNLSDDDMKEFFELSSNSDEREYLKQRYRKCVPPQDYLEFIKDESKYVTKKRFQWYIDSHSDKESVDYLLNVNPLWYGEIVEKEFLKDFIVAKEPLLKDFFEGEWLKKKVEEVKGMDDVVAKSCGLLKGKYEAADSPQYRQILLRIIVGYLRFLEMSSVEKQIFFREYVSNQMEGVKYNPDGYESENGILYSLIEPLYINSLETEEQEKYIKMKERAEEEYRAEKEKRKQAEEKRKKEIAEKEAELSAEQDLLDQKWQENEKVVGECNTIGHTRDEISKQVDEMNCLGVKYRSQIIWSCLVVGCYSLVFTRVSAVMVVVPIMIFCFSIALFVKQHKIIGTLSILSLFSLLITVAILNNDEVTVGERAAGLLIACSPLVALGIFAVKRMFDIKRLNSEVQKKVVEDEKKLEKQNALAAKNTELIKEIEKRQKEINRLQAEIDNLKNENHSETKDAELDSEIEQLLNMN